LSEEEKWAEVGYVEGFNAADARVVSAMALGRQQVAEDAIDGERSWRVVEGYDRVPEFLAERVRAAGGVIEFQAQVEEVAWGDWGVEVGVKDGRRFKAERCVVALPLGVLQPYSRGYDAPRFRPEPTRVFEAMKKMRMGDAYRVTMVFRKRLWPEGMSFLLAREQEVQVWWTAHPAESLTLTGWVGGPRATEFRNTPEDQAIADFVRAAANAFGVPDQTVRRALVSAHTHDWHWDAYSLGAYSYVAVGGVEASAEMSEPVEGRLFFAGEHTDTTGHWGTVHAALRSGLRAGRQVVES
jgi:monoamine oxidase